MSAKMKVATKTVPSLPVKYGFPLTATLQMLTLLFLGILQFNPFVTAEDNFIHVDDLAESVKGMLDEGFSQQEIVNNVKMELGVRRINTLIGKVYSGAELTDEEIIQAKSGEVSDTDKDLVDVLEKFGVYISESQGNSTTATQVDNFTWRNEHDSDTSEMMESDESVEDEKVAKRGAQDVLSSGNLLPKPDYAYSPYDLIRLVKAEETIYKPLSKYIKKMEQKLKILKSYTMDYEDNSLAVTRALGSESNIDQRANAIVSNPLASFKMIKRFAYKLPDVWSAVAEDFEEELWENLSKVSLKHQPPNKQDWLESMEALFRIQYYNGFDAKQFANGVLGSLKSKVSLTAEDCMEIGLRASALDFHDFALEWLHLAKTKYLSDDDQSVIDLNFLDQSLEFAIKQHNNAWNLRQVNVNSHVFTKKLRDPSYIDKAIKQSSRLRELSKAHRQIEEYDIHVPYNFVSLCAGETLQPEHERSRLGCWLETSKHPYFTIAPVKIEKLSEDPYVIQAYDVIGDNLIDDIKRRSIMKLRRSEVINYEDPEAADVSLVRTSSQSWLHPWEIAGDKRYESLANLIEKITGLNTRKSGSSEDYQVACYGTSHHYDEHLDAVQDPRRTEENGERVGTFMIYLSTVEEGGYTGFPVIGISAKPIKGSAVFWYNLKKNGNPDKRTWHGGCPVVHGIKWVMNNWILLNENFRGRQCGLRKED